MFAASAETANTGNVRREEAGPVLFSMGSTTKSGRSKPPEKVAHTPLTTSQGSFRDFVFDGHNLPDISHTTPSAQRSNYSLGRSDLLDDEDDDDELPPYTPAAGHTTPSVRMTTNTSSVNSRFLHQQQNRQNSGGYSMGASDLLREEDSPSNPGRLRTQSEDGTASLASDQSAERMIFGVQDDSDDSDEEDEEVLQPMRTEGEDSLGSLLFQFHSAKPALVVAPDAQRSSKFSFPVPPVGDSSTAQQADTLSAHMNEAFRNIDMNSGLAQPATAVGGTSFAFNMGSSIKPKRRVDWGKKTPGNSGGASSTSGSASFLFASFDKDVQGNSQHEPFVFPPNSNVPSSSSSRLASSSVGAAPSTPSDAPPGWWFNNANINISNSYPAMDSDNDTEDGEEREEATTYDFSRPLPSRPQQQAMPPPTTKAPLFDSSATPIGGLGSFPFAPPVQSLPSLNKTSPVRPFSGFGVFPLPKSASGPLPSASGSDPHTIRMAELYGTQGKDAYAQEKYLE